MAAAQRVHRDSTPAGAPAQDREGNVLDERSVLERLESQSPIDPLRPSMGIANGFAIGFAIWLLIAVVVVAVALL